MAAARRRIGWAAALLCPVLVAGACSSPTQLPNLTGTWKGTSTDSSEGGQHIWTLTQSGNAVTGTATIIGSRTGFQATGPVNGTLTGQAFAFSFTLTFAAPFQFCTAFASGTLHVTNNTVLDGSYTGGNSCEGGPFTTGTVTLTKQ